jgi:hypothetical protein
MLPLCVSAGTSFVDLLNSPLPFKIPIQDLPTINQFPHIFEYGRTTEYGYEVDSWNQHHLLSYTSEQAVVILDGNWQGILSLVLQYIWMNTMFPVRKS